MAMSHRTYRWMLKFAIALLLVGWPAAAHAYITVPVTTLGQLCTSTHVTVLRVEKVDREKGIIYYRKVRDLKGKYPQQMVRHAFDLKNTPAHQGSGDVPIRPDEKDWRHAMKWAEAGKTAVMFSLKYDPYGDFGHTYIDGCWYATMCPKRDWDFWYSIYSDPALLSRWHCGTPAHLISAVEAVLAGKDSVVPVLVEGSRDDLRAGSAKVSGLRVSLSLATFDFKRDKAPWRGITSQRLAGWHGFSHLSGIEALDGEVLGISLTDLDGSDNLGVCLVGTGRVAMAQSAGDNSFIKFPAFAGARAAVWADYNGDGRPDLFLATVAGPKLYTNLVGGAFRDDTKLLPSESHYTLTAAAWIDYDGDGWPDLLLGNGFHGLRLFRNKGNADLAPATKAGSPGLWFEDVSKSSGFGNDGLGNAIKGDTLTVCDVNDDGRADVLYGAGSGLLLMNTPQGFVEARDCGIHYKPGKVGPVFADFDNSGFPGLFVPQLDGRCKLFKNDGKGRFTDVTAKAGDLSKPMGMATSAAWGDMSNSGNLDLVVGCLRGPNRYFRNRGDGTFEDATENIGLHQKIFNTQGVCLADINKDGVLDLICNNQSQESAVLFGRRDRTTKKTAVAIQVAGRSGIIGSRVRLFDQDGKLQGMQDISGGDGRGSQPAPVAHFSVSPGNYKAVVRFSSGMVRTKHLTVASLPLRLSIDDQPAKE